MPWGAAIAAAGAIGSAAISSSAAGDATKAQTDAANKAAGYLQPYMGAGGNALQALQGFIGVGADGSFNPHAPGVAPFSADAFRSSPGYQFQLDQGLSAINNRATTGAGVNSGNTLAELMRYGQGLASQDFYKAANLYRTNQQDVLSALGGLTDIGKQAAGGAGGIALQSGNALAAGSVAQGQIAGNALTSLTAGTSGTPSIIQQLYQSMFSGGGGMPNGLPVASI